MSWCGGVRVRRIREGEVERGSTRWWEMGKMAREIQSDVDEEETKLR
jgi:hypothetical protein